MVLVIHCYNGENSVWGHQIGFRLNPRPKFIAFPLSFIQIASFTLCLVHYCFTSSTVADSQFIAWSVVFA